MTHHRTSLIRLLLTALAGLGLTVAPVQAELLVNGFASSGREGRTPGAATYQPHTRAAPGPANPDRLLDGLFHPLGLMLAVSFFPPGFDLSKPTPTPSVPGDPTITIAVPGLPQIVVPPPTSIGTPYTQTKTSTSTDGSTSTTPPVKKSPEPATLVSGLLGAGLLGWVRWRRRKAV